MGGMGVDLRSGVCREGKRMGAGARMRWVMGFGAASRFRGGKGGAGEDRCGEGKCW
ncbi:hypothetical protein C1H46_037037 [Malus baccata]|uniref:Uncharacterized protein n=1 Tax=Malus baccata TaxID=106549 RepID=A0A540KT79_MALBA|nr:hypothetical protein C1H46_037037 [Malus baccata]